MNTIILLGTSEIFFFKYNSFQVFLFVSGTECYLQIPPYNMPRYFQTKI